MPAKQLTKTSQIKQITTMKSRSIITLLIAFTAVLFVVFIAVCRYNIIDGYERGVYIGVNGVGAEPAQPGLAWWCPLTTSLKVANIGQQRFVMNNMSSSTEKALGREKDEFVVKSADNQNMYVSAELLFHRDPTKIILQQNTIGNVDDDELLVERVIRQPMQTEIKNYLTDMLAIDAYSGPKHVKAQLDIEKILKAETYELAKKGVIVERLLIEVRLDDTFTKPIVDRQIAIQQELAYKQQERAALADAEKTKALAMSDYNKIVVEAERDKKVAILNAEQNQQKTILAAEGAKQQVVLAAQGEKEAAQNRADAILAEGKARAESQRLQYAAYSAPGAETFAKIEVAKQMAIAFGNVKGFIPAGMNISTFTTDFTKGLGSFSLPLQPETKVQGQ